jgi:hypothetical protein
VMGVIVPLFLILELKKKNNPTSLWRKGYVVASKTGEYQREGSLTTTW